tara:strand:+ start:60 stop:482 length:423 start_codon:yes stop_codon:yes gene_type:complete
MTKFLYFRLGTATASEDDNTTGSNVYPVENFMGAVSGTSDGNGAVTDDDNAISLFLKPIMKTQTAEVDAADADPDVIVLACAQYGQKALLKALLNKINGGPHDDNFITLFDGYDDIATGEPTSDVSATGLTIVAQQVAAD